MEIYTPAEIHSGVLFSVIFFIPSLSTESLCLLRTRFKHFWILPGITCGGSSSKCSFRVNQSIGREVTSWWQCSHQPEVIVGDSRSRSPVTLRACAVPCTFQMVTPWLRNSPVCRFIYTWIEIKTIRCDKRSMQLPSDDPVATTLQRLRNHALAVCRVIATKLLIMKRWSGTKTSHSDTDGQVHEISERW